MVSIIILWQSSLWVGSRGRGKLHKDMRASQEMMINEKRLSVQVNPTDPTPLSATEINISSNLCLKIYLEIKTRQFPVNVSWQVNANIRQSNCHYSVFYWFHVSSVQVTSLAKFNTAAANLSVTITTNFSAFEFLHSSL